MSTVPKYGLSYRKRYRTLGFIRNIYPTFIRLYPTFRGRIRYKTPVIVVKYSVIRYEISHRPESSCITSIDWID